MILDTIIKPKRIFNVKSKEDVALYTEFLKKFRWGTNGCPFTLEYPYLTVPDMIKDKLIHHFLNVSR